MMTKPRAHAWARYLLSLAVMLLGLACKAPSSGSYAEAPAYYEDSYDDYGGGGGGAPGSAGDYEADYDAVVTESVSRAAPSRAAKKEFKAERERNVGAKDAPSPDPAPAPSESSVEPEPLVVPDEPATPAPVSLKRQIIYTATMQVSVYDLEHALELVEALPDRFGGWLQQRVDNQLVLRVPAERLDEVIATVAALGVVDYRLLEALDVTAEYTDLESRIRVMAEMQKQLQALLARASSVEQALEIRRALDQITLELETARAQMRELAKSVAFSTLILRLVERGPGVELPSSNDPFPWVDELGVEATDYR